MEQIWLGRPADAAARFLEQKGIQVCMVSYVGKREEPAAQDMRVMRCRIKENVAELVVCKFQTDILQEERQTEL